MNYYLCDNCGQWSNVEGKLREKIDLFQKFKAAPMSDATKIERETIRKTLNVVITELRSIL